MKFNKLNNTVQKAEYQKNQSETVLETVRSYNKSIPVVQNMDFGHTNPQICLSIERRVKIESDNKAIKSWY